MTLAQFAMTFWHDLAAPILAGNYYAAIVGWWRNPEVKGENGRQAAMMAICAKPAAGVTACGHFIFITSTSKYWQPELEASSRALMK